MSTNIRFAIVLFFSFLFLYVQACSDKSGQKSLSEDNDGAERILEFTAEVSFLRSQEDTISTVHVAVADDNRSRSEGLMNVMELPEDSGMLFIFENEQPRSFWMANTPLPLDIIFVNSEMTIVRIHRNTQPYSQRSIQSGEPARFVVEVNAGYTLEHDIREGMLIRVKGVEL